MTEENNFKIEQTENIKLMKMSKGYQWEIKIFPIPISDLDESGRPTGEKIYRLGELDIDRLEHFNNELEKRFNFNQDKGESKI